MSALLIRHLKPFSCTSSMTVSIFWYETKVYSGGVQKLTEPPFGKEKSRMRRKEPLSSLGTRPKGKQIKLSNGGSLKGPLILPFRISLLMFCTTTSGFFLALLWLFGNF
jgi:hypothetical protein